MTKARLLFIIATIIFIIAVVAVVYDMSSKTIKPWEKKKNKKEQIF